MNTVTVTVPAVNYCAVEDESITITAVGDVVSLLLMLIPHPWAFHVMYLWTS